MEEYDLIPDCYNFDFKKQPTDSKAEVKWLRNAIWFVHTQLEASPEHGEHYKNTHLENEYDWLPLFTAIINEFEKSCGVIISSGWYLVMREYWYFPEAWNSLPFKLKINRDWGQFVGHKGKISQEWLKASEDFAKKVEQF
jgi:hypothetical protein